MDHVAALGGYVGAAIGSVIVGIPGAAAGATVARQLAASLWSSGSSGMSDHVSEYEDKQLQEKTDWWLMSPQSVEKDTVYTRAANDKNQSTKFLVLRLKLGSVAEQKDDVLVSSVGRDLNLSNGKISRSLLMKAGDDMQQELNTSYRSGIEEFDFVASKGHGLSCKRVLHVVCGAIKEEESETKFVSVLFRCLLYVAEAKMRSIAFPPIGTGNLHYPPAKVAELFYQAVHQFWMIHHRQSLEMITIAVSDPAKYQIFQSTLENLLQESPFLQDSAMINAHRQLSTAGVESDPSYQKNAIAMSEPQPSSAGIEGSTVVLKNNEATQLYAEAGGGFEGQRSQGDTFIMEGNKKGQFCMMAPQDSNDVCTASEESNQRLNKGTAQVHTETGDDELKKEGSISATGNSDAQIMLINKGRKLTKASNSQGEHCERADSCPFIFLMLHVHSRVHITKYCLEELKILLKNEPYSLHCTEVPGELLLERRGPVSSENDQLVIRRIYEYADRFITIVKLSEHLTGQTLPTIFTGTPSAEMSCIKLCQHGNGQLFAITSKRDRMPSMPIEQIIPMAFTSVAEMENKLVSKDCLACRAEGARKSDDSAALTTTGVTATGLKSDAKSNGIPAAIFESHSDRKTAPVYAELATTSNCPTCQLSSNGMRQQKGSMVLSTDPTPQLGVPESAPTMQQNVDNQMIAGHVQRQSPVPPKTIPGSTFVNEQDFRQRNRELLKMEDCKQLSQQCSERSNESDESFAFQTEEQWLEEQVRKGTSKGRVLIWSNNSASSRIQSNEQSRQQVSELSFEASKSADDQTEEEWLSEQKQKGTPLGIVMFWSSSSASSSTTEQRLRHINYEETDL